MILLSAYIQAFHLYLLFQPVIFKMAELCIFKKTGKRNLFMSSPAAPPVMPELSNRVRRLIYQASYTGMKETDLLLGHFAKMHLPHLNE